MRRSLGLLLTFLMLASAWAGETRAIMLDGKVLPGLQYVLVEGEPYFPLPQLAAAAKVDVKDDGAGTLAARGFTFKGRRVGGQFVFSRADVKRALGVTVFLEKGRAVVVTEAGREKAGLVGPRGASAGGSGAPGRAVPLLVYSVDIDRTTSQMMRVRASVRNDAGMALKGVSITFALWLQGEGETPDTLTGERVAKRDLYSEYPQTLGDMQPGEVKRFEVITSVLNPTHIDQTHCTIHLDVRDLRYGFKGSASNAEGLASSQQGSVKKGEGQQLAVEGLTLDLEKRFDSGSPRLLVVRGYLRNVTDHAIAGELVLHLWEDGAPTRRAKTTGDTVGLGGEYSIYSTPFGPIAVGGMEKFEIRTTIAEPHSVDAIDRTIAIEQGLGTTSKVTRLRMGFTAK